MNELPLSVSPSRRAWLRFRQHKRGYYSLWLFMLLFVVSLGAEWLSNDRPLVVYYQQQWYFPLWQDYPETTFGSEFATPTDYHDPFVQQQLQQADNWALWPPNRYRFDSLDYYAEHANPAAPDARHWLGTDDRGRDIAARLAPCLRAPGAT